MENNSLLIKFKKATADKVRMSISTNYEFWLTGAKLLYHINAICETAD